MKNVFRYLLVLCFLFFVEKSFSFEYKKIVAQKWYEYSTDNFLVVTDLKKDKVETLLSDLENYHYFLTEIIGIEIPDELPRLPFLVVSEYKNFKAIGLPLNIGGLFSLKPYGYSAIANAIGYVMGQSATNKARHTIYHEYYHFVTFLAPENRQRHLPGWYIEGMAEYWATFKTVNNKAIIGDPETVADRVFDLYTASKSEGLINSELLLSQDIPAIGDASDEGQRTLGRFYARSFFLVHYLNSSQYLQGAMDNYLNRIQEGVAEQEAFKKSFNFGYIELNNRIKSYITSGELMARTFEKDGGGFNFPELLYKSKKLKSKDKSKFFASLFWDSKLIDLSVSERAVMLQNALKRNPNDKSLSEFLDKLRDFKEYP